MSPADRRRRAARAEVRPHDDQVVQGDGCRSRHACASRSPEGFVDRITAVARHAKRTKATLMLLTQLDYLPIALL